ncbi:hypothetical protein [Pseudomonas putida]
MHERLEGMATLTHPSAIVLAGLRFGAFAVQLIVAAVWCWALINLYLQ